MGDIVCTLPGVEVIKQRDPSLLIAYLCHRSLVAIPRLSRVVDQVLGIRCNDQVAAALTGLGCRVLAPRYADEHMPPRPSVSESLSAAMARSMGVDPSELSSIDLAIPEPSPSTQAWLASALAPGRRLVALHTGPTARVRQWPDTHWLEFLRLLERTAPELQPVLLGQGSHFQLGTRPTPALPGVLDARSLSEPLDFLAVLARCSAFVGVDSGMLHVAVALRLPSIGLFGATLPARRMPADQAALGLQAADVPCLGCHHRQPREHWDFGCPRAIRCMGDLAPSVVAGRLLHLLRGAPRHAP
jgi:ADP-heptose:LPS heptosyltransferase